MITEQSPAGARWRVAPRSTADPLDSVPGWIHEIERRLSAMENLQVGWDSYGGAMISRAVLLAVKQWLRAVATIDTVPPSVVPLGSGGVQVEWHDRGRDLEVAIETPGVFEVCYSSPDRTIDGEMTEDQIRDLIPVRIVQ